MLATLKAEQAINVKETAERYLLTVIDGESKLPQSHSVLEVGQDFVVVKDFTGLNETRIPITSVKAVVHFKGFDRKQYLADHPWASRYWQFGWIAALGLPRSQPDALG